MSRSDLLRLAYAGLAPDRIAPLLERARPKDVLQRMLDGRLRVPDAARKRMEPDAGEREAELREAGVRFLLGEELPAWTRDLPDAPRWLFWKGAAVGCAGVAVVGSRRASGYGLGVAERIGRAVALLGWPVVSGLAAGVDGAAHRGCLEGGGRGIAVLGSGIDVWYPARHRRLGEALLAAGGAVISEFPPGTPPEPWRFPLRNRIISGLSSVVVVVEAAARSGALITARMAMEQGREVIAVPGDIDRPTSEGCNLLIRDGAHPLTGIDDLGEMLALMMGPPPNAAASVRLLPEPWSTLLGPVPVPLDEVVEGSGMGPGEAMSRLADLELSGLVRIEAGMVRLA